MEGRFEGESGAAGATVTSTDPAGFFELAIERPASSTDDGIATPDHGLFLDVKDQFGNQVLRTQSRENRTQRVDFQIKLGDQMPTASSEPDVYSGGFERLISRYTELGGAIDSSDQGVRQSLEYVVGVVRAWSVNRDELDRACGRDAIQVPEHSRTDRHNHVTRWDEVVLKV